MKKKIVIFITTLALLMSMTMPAFAEEMWYGRYGEVGDTEELQTIYQLSEGIYENYGIDAFYFYSDENSGAGSAKNYAEIVTGNITSEPNVILYSKTYDDVYVLRWGTCIESFDENEINELIEVCSQYEAVGNYDVAAITFFSNVSAVLAQEAVGGSFEASGQEAPEDYDVPFDEMEDQPISGDAVPAVAEEVTESAISEVQTESAEENKGSTVEGLLISFVVGLIAAFIVISSIKSKYKPVRKNTEASDYLVGGSVQITGGYENFVRTDTSRREINNNNQNNQQKHR